MTTVQTVTGPVQDSQLGATLSHEHVFVNSPDLPHQYPWLYDRETALAHAVTELEEAKAAGIGSIIDVTTPDLGRDIELMREAGRRSGVHIVAATGIWLEAPRWFQRATLDEVVAVFTHEIEVGIAGTDVRAGVIKVANNNPPGVGELQEKILRAATRAAMATGVPISTHTSPYDVGREQMRVFAAEGLPPHLATIGHAQTGDVDYLREVVERGHYLSIDHWRPGRDGESDVLDAVTKLCEEGHAGHVTLGHDNVPEGYDWWPHGEHEGPSLYTYVPTTVRAQLAERGVTAAHFAAMLVTAPARFLSGGRGE